MSDYIIYSFMRKYSMLVGAILLVTVNFYGFLISVIIQPITPAVTITSIIGTLTIAYIELNKKRVLLRTCIKESFIMFAAIILWQLYYTIMAFTELIYLNSIEHHLANSDLRLNPFTVGLTSMPIHQVQILNLPYYFLNFLLFMFYIRCFYIMFWRQNIIFIFRYLKAHVSELNQSLLSHLPKISCTEQLSQSICSLCLQNYNYSQDITKLHCQHIFHLDCIKIWVMKSNNCPLCRKKVVF